MMIYIHDIKTLSRMCREHWCCEYVINYVTIDGVSDCDMIIGVKL